MNKLNRVSAFIFSVLTTVFIGGAISANTVLDNQDAGYETAKASINAECVLPLNRDYHDVLSAYNDDKSDEYKFSGCGGVI